MIRTLLQRLVLALALAVLGPNATALADANRHISIGSKNFTENRLLAEILAQLIEAQTDITVERRVNLGGTTVVFEALKSGEIDLYPEYTGTGWAVHLKRTEPVSDPTQAYLRVAEDFPKRFKLSWLRPFGFSNSYALAMAEDRAAKLGVRTLSGLLQHQHRIRAGLSHEFLNRKDGYIGLAETYGFNFPQLAGMEHGLAYEALDGGGIDLIDTWTTDGKLQRYKLRVLEDDRHFFPPYDCAPVISNESLLRFPELRPVIEQLAFRIPNAKMSQLNFQVEERGGRFEAVAKHFLESAGLLAAARIPKESQLAPPQSRSLLDRLSRRKLWNQLLQHLSLAGAAMLLAILFAIPCGVFVARRPRFASSVLALAGAVQTIPSLALLALMIPVPGLGLGPRSAVAALFLYAILPILRNTVTGIAGTDPLLLDAAQGMGLYPRQILLRIQLPLAARTIMAGVRTSAVMSVGMATLAAFIGAGGLGDPILTGLQLNDMQLVLSGALPAAALALMVDFALGRAERALAPKGL